MALHDLALSCTILHYLALSCTIFHYLSLSCTILHYLAISCTILHLRYTCSQQMRPVIAFDIAVVAQKVKVQCCYIMAEMLNLKKWRGCWVSNRSGWQLELLTEPSDTPISNRNGLPSSLDPWPWLEPGSCICVLDTLCP